MSRVLEIGDAATLNALTRALIAAKFQLDPEDRDVPGSTIIATLANEVAEVCAELLVEEGRTTIERANRWREPSQHTHAIACVRARICECEPWRSWDAAERARYVQTLLAPYLPDADVVAALREYGDEHHG